VPPRSGNVVLLLVPSKVMVMDPWAFVVMRVFLNSNAPPSDAGALNHGAVQDKGGVVSLANPGTDPGRKLNRKA
jgi:hypothetical protein